VLSGLVLCNLIWAFNPTFTKILLPEVGALSGAIWRYGSALLTFFLWLLARRWVSKPSLTTEPISKPTRRILILVGVFTFFMTPLAHMWGLNNSTAISGSFVVAMEPLVAVLLAWLILKERLKPKDAFALAMAVVGFLILARVPQQLLGWEDINAPVWNWLGDLVLLLGIVGEAAGSIGARKLADRLPASQVFGWSLFVGVGLLIVLLGVVTVMNWGAFALPTSSSAWWSILWIGPLGTTATYIFWMYALQRNVPLSHVVVTLLLQPVIGLAAGLLFLGETVSILQIFGGSLILLGVWLQN